jgi:superkiller protein 3
VSRLPVAGAAVAGLLLVAGCASGTSADLRRLQAKAAYERGFADLNDGRFGAGFAGLREAVSLDPDNPTYHMVLGKWLLELKQPEFRHEAITHLRRAVELDPANPYARHTLGVALMEDSRWSEAIAEFGRVLSEPTFPEPEMARSNLGFALYQVGKLSEAEDSLRMALSFDPAYAPAYYNLGLVLVGQKRLAEARLAFRRAQELAPDSPFGGAAAAHLRALGDGG